METKTKTNTASPTVQKYWDRVEAWNLNNAQRFELGMMLLNSYQPATTEPKKSMFDDDFDVEEYERNLRPYTMEEINAMLDEAEADIAAGRMIPEEEAWSDEELELMGLKEPELAMAV
ncbi:MAG: hypothetical protein J6T60_10495 [Bacteroidales bacterium]|nr:hypothetical protein [Bacteroidales bacterium]MBO7567505.1 hypothetical protein [Bacteroidales bacterium]